MKQNHSFEYIILALFLIAFGIIARVLPHPANVAPIAALALFAGIYLPKRLALILPMAAMFISDFFVGFYNWKIMLAVYASFILIGCIGLLIQKNKNFFTIATGALSGSILFFLITNAAVWAFSAMYAKTFSGLLESYRMALPFFRNTLFGDIAYSALFIGGFEAIRWALQMIRMNRFQKVERGQTP